MNKRTTIIKTCLCAAFAALIFVSTFFFAFPLIGGGYANLGDLFVILAGFILGPIYGALAAGVGAALSDLLLGYSIYAPATFIIKAAMAISAYYILKIDKKRNGLISNIFVIISSFSAEIIMVAGYFLFECFIYSLPVAIADIPGNCAQGVIGAVAATATFLILKKTGVIEKISKRL